MTLHQYLINIHNGLPINFSNFCKKLPAHVKWQAIFNPEPFAKNKHLVSIKDEALFNELLQQTQIPTNRNEAAAHSIRSSHDYKCQSAYMLCFPAAHRQYENELANQAQVVVVNNKHLQSPFPFAKKAVFIENQDCFFDWQSLLNHFGGNVKFGDCDIYFSAGSRILNSALSELLMQYDDIYCAFDYDFAGVSIYQRLCSNVRANCHFLLPTPLDLYASLFTFTPNSTAEFSDSLALCQQLELLALGKIMQTTRGYMEQEALLTIQKPDNTENR